MPKAKRIGAFRVRCEFCHEILESWHVSERDVAPEGVKFGTVYCECVRTSADNAGVPDMGRVSVRKPPETEID